MPNQNSKFHFHRCFALSLLILLFFDFIRFIPTPHIHTHMPLSSSRSPAHDKIIYQHKFCKFLTSKTHIPCMHMFLFPSTTQKLRRGRWARGGGRARAKSLVGLASLILYFNLVCVSVYYICNCRLYSTVFSIFQREYFGTFYGNSSTFNLQPPPHTQKTLSFSFFIFQIPMGL